VLNKVYTDSSGNTIGLQAQTSKETLNAVLNTSTNSLNVSLSGSNTISGDVTITGDLTVQGGGSLAFDEIIEGTQVVEITNTEAFLVRKASDGGDVFIVDTTNSRVGVGIAPTVDLDISSPSGDVQARLFRNANVKTSLTFKNSLQEWEIGNSVGDNNKFTIRDITDSRNAFVIDGSGDATFAGDITLTGGDIFSANLGLQTTNGTGTIYLTGGVVVNDAGNDVDFRVESDGNANMLFVDGGNNRVGIGTSSPQKLVHLDSSSGFAEMRLSGTGGGGTVEFYNDSTALGDIFFDTSKRFHVRTNGATTALTVDENQNVGIGGVTSPEYPIHVSGGDSAIYLVGTTQGRVILQDSGATSGSQAFDIVSVDDKLKFRRLNDARSGVSATVLTLSGDKVGIGTGSPDQLLHINAGSSDNAFVKLSTTGSGEAGFYIDGDDGDFSGHWTFIGVDNTNNNLTFNNVGADDIIFKTTNAERVRIASDGNVGIGTGLDTIDARLHVKGATDVAKFQSSSGATNTIYTDSSDSLVGQIEFGASGSQIVTRTSSTLSLGSNNVKTLHITDDDRVGIGTASPTKKLEIAGDIKLLNGTNNITVFYGGDNWGQRVIYNTGNMDFFLNGENRFVIDTNSRISLSNNDGGADNTVFGKLAGNALTTNGDENVLIGHEAGNDVSTGERNVFIGYQSGDKITSGTRSVAIGYGSLGSEQAGERSIAIGFNALSQQNVGANTYNTAVGVEAGFYNRTGTKNTFLGYNAGLGASEQSNSNNTAVGYSSMIDVTTGSDNVAVGIQSLQNLTSGSRNVALGYFAMAQSIDTNDTVAIGRYAMGAGDVANDGQIAIGRNALAELTSGSENIAVGYLSGDTITTGTKNTCIGYNTDVSDAGAINRTGLGNGITLGANNSVVLGNNDVTDIYMAQDGGARIHCSQIQFPASQDASSDPNRLDDYEEGYHDIAVTGSSSGSMTFNTSFNQLSYTKIGRQVHVTGEVRVASDNSISGDLRFTLPFALADLNQNSGYAVGNVHLSGHGDASIDDNKTFLYATDGNQYFQIAHVADDDTFTFINNSHVDTAFNITVSITYFSA
jgi:hypothetical protein